MPPGLDLEPYRFAIALWIGSGLSHGEILNQLQERNVDLSLVTLMQQLRKWEDATPDKLNDSLNLHHRIGDLFQLVNASDQEIQQLLRRTGFEVDLRTLQRVRLRIDQLMPHGSDRQKQAKSQTQKAHPYDFRPDSRTIFESHRSHRGVQSSDNTVHRKCPPGGASFVTPPSPSLIAQLLQLQEQMKVLGPDHVWSIGASSKLEPWGVQMHAALDVYSRHILWFSIGLQAKSTVSVFTQYVKVVADSGKMPVIIRSTRTPETIHLSNAHVFLRQFVQQDVVAAPLQFEDCYDYTSGIENRVIANWWSQQARVLNRWRQHFDKITEDGEYIASRLADRIALLAVYMPIIRHECFEFRDLMKHSKRRVKDSPDGPAGHPELLYKYPSVTGGEQQGIPAPPSVLEMWQDDLRGSDLDEYLPKPTLEWCEDFLEQQGVLVPTKHGRIVKYGPVEWEGRRIVKIEPTKIRELAYSQLRDAISLHNDQRRQPRLVEKSIADMSSLDFIG